jgi:hypothetical protein
MHNSDSNAPSTLKRTAAEAVQQADAKDRVRTARAVRTGGYVLTLLGLWLATKPSEWRANRQAVGVNIHGGPHFTLSFGALFGIASIVLGPVVAVVGHLLLKRATAAALRNPVTAQIFTTMDMD